MLIVTRNGEHTEELTIGGSTFYYKLCGWGRFNQLRRQCRNERTMIVDDVALDEALLKGHVVDWKDVVGRDGQELSFDADLLMKLPPVVIQTLLGGILAPAVKEEEQQGNSVSSSST